MTDRRVIRCNYLVATKKVPKGAAAYLSRTNPGDDDSRIVVVARSHSGRWIQTWEGIHRLGDFRAKTLPPEHPLYGDDRLWPYVEVDEDALGDEVTRLNFAANERRTARS